MKRVCVFEMGPEAFFAAHAVLNYYDVVYADPAMLMLAEGMPSECSYASLADLTEDPVRLADARVVIVADPAPSISPQWAYSVGASEVIDCTAELKTNSLDHCLMRAWARGQPLPESDELNQAMQELKSSSYQSLPDAGLSDGEGGTQYDADGRKGKQRGVPVTGAIADALKSLAEDFAGRPLECEALHLMAYRAGDHFLPHTDEYLPEEVADHGMPDRKVSVSLELSDEAEYSEGCLRIFATGSFHDTPKKQGWVTVFSSDVTHEVVEIGEGERRAVVGWYTHA